MINYIKQKKQEETKFAIKVNNMNLLLEADYSSAESIIDGIKENRIHLKNGKNLVNNGSFKMWLKTFISLAKRDNIPVNKVLAIAIDKGFNNSKFMSTTDMDALKYYVKYKSSSNFKDLFNEFETTKMSLNEFHNKAQELSEQTRNGKRALRKAETSDADIEVLYNKNGWKVTTPKTWQASIKAATFPFGKAPWCTASSNAQEYFNQYTGDGKYKLFIISNGTKENTFQVVFNPKYPDVEDFRNTGATPDFSKVPDEVLKLCKSGNRNLYDFCHLTDIYKNIVRTKTGKDGWTSKTTLNPFGGNKPRFYSYMNGDYDKETFKQNLKNNIRDDKSSYVSKEYIKGDRRVKQSDYRGKKLFDKASNNANDDFYGIVNDREYEQEKDIPRKVKSDVYQRKTEYEKKHSKGENFAYEEKIIKPNEPEFKKLTELGILNNSSMNLKISDEKIETIRLVAHYLDPANSKDRYAIIYKYINGSPFRAGHITHESDPKLFEYCMVHYFKKFVKDWKDRGNYLSDIIKGKPLHEEWKQKVLNILK